MWNAEGNGSPLFTFAELLCNFSKLAFMAASVSVAIAFSTGRSLHSPLPGDSERVQLYQRCRMCNQPLMPVWINARSGIRKGIRLPIMGSEPAHLMFARKHCRVFSIPIRGIPRRSQSQDYPPYFSANLLSLHTDIQTNQLDAIGPMISSRFENARSRSSIARQCMNLIHEQRIEAPA